MRILHAIHDFLPRHRAGAELYAHALAREQIGRGHHVHVLCAEYDPRGRHGAIAWRRYGRVPAELRTDARNQSTKAPTSLRVRAGVTTK